MLVKAIAMSLEAEEMGDPSITESGPGEPYSSALAFESNNLQLKTMVKMRLDETIEVYVP